MKIKAVQLAVVLATLAASVLAAEGPVPKGVPHLDHVFLIMMENHGFAQIVNNPKAPFVESAGEVGEPCHELLRHRPSQFDKLSRGSGWVEFRRAQRQQS